MRKPLALLAAVILAASLVIWWELRRVSWDFAVSIAPGWHVPILAPWAVAYVVGGVLVAGIVLAILIRAAGGGARGEGQR